MAKSKPSAVITGTIGELAKKELKLNGVVLDQPALSVLTRIGEESFVRNVGQQKRVDGKGRSAVIWEFQAEFSAKFEF